MFWTWRICGTAICRRTLSNYNLPYCIYFDNFFTSLPLIDELTKRNVKACGTIRKNRIAKCPLASDNEIKKQRPSSSHKITTSNDIQVVKWSDNNIVLMVSNQHNVEPFHHVSRFSQKEKKRVTVPQPESIYRYNT